MIETSFCELRTKSVINVVDGKNLGNICDIVLEICSGRILGFVVPLSRGFASLFKGNEDLFIPYQNIYKIGQDVILVQLNLTEYKNFKTSTFSEISQTQILNVNSTPQQTTFDDNPSQRSEM